ncbi:putative nuclear pore complex protein an-nup82 protein [Botrytis fragariae]|uniref:Putative nuclear pore complex protein an-nup82 protein n=1 Tax=Botrytis fragariae TaxID=1964551 RepID=A0A8H6AKV6_9HELO|nr:putative nuclear pore complex protein an-nup82 protein [Botrytis fragariae]KAF5869173.1 putative nuclear pore complex protein an-nup82 protein [Botrytis fragariae]
MPQVLGYTPTWLSKPNPGHEIFTAKPTGIQTASGASYSPNEKKTNKVGPKRTIARRGTEIFIAVGKEIRWADLVYLKETWENKQENQRSFLKGKTRAEEEIEAEENVARGYRTLKIPVADEIRQLIISPNSNFMAILTTHTVHVAILPESSHLTAPDNGPMKIKTFHLGPTTHVTSRSGISTALWHPLGVNGTCLVTITKDAVVRVWELSTTDRWSFDKPTLVVDLKKLADGVSADQDFGASVAGQPSKFSPDAFEMEVASACFAGRGAGGWSPMTLWLAMREGDVYALCPLLPEKWAPPPTLIPSLSISIVSNIAAIEDDPTVTQGSKLLAQQQLDWMTDIDSQDPTQVQGTLGEPPIEVYTRPSRPGKVPRLQGPFDFEMAPEVEDDEDDELFSDIYVIGPKLDAEELMDGEEDDELELDEVDKEGCSMSVICLLTTTGRLSICLDLVGIEAQWLPRSNSRMLRFLDDPDPPVLLTYEVLETSKPNEVWEGCWPTFSNDVESRYSFFITNNSNITYMSLSTWVFKLEEELSKGAESNVRLGVIVSTPSERQRVYTPPMIDKNAPLAASTIIQDPDLGYFLLSANAHGPLSINFESPQFQLDFNRSRGRSESYDSETDNDKPLILFEARPVYQPSYALEQPSELPSLHEKIKHSKYKRLLKEEIRLSPATLTVMTDAHKVLSEETHRIGTAAAELFRKCIKLQIELSKHIKQANEIATRVESVIGEDVDEDDDKPRVAPNENMERRIQEAKDKQKILNERIENIRKKIPKNTQRELSDKEKAWIEEVRSLGGKVLGEDMDGSTESMVKVSKDPWQRYEEVKELKDEVLSQANELAKDAERERDEEQQEERDGDSARDVQVPSELRRKKVGQIMKLLDRETALVEATKGRLERLSLA